MHNDNSSPAYKNGGASRQILVNRKRVQKMSRFIFKQVNDNQETLLAQTTTRKNPILNLTNRIYLNFAVKEYAQ